MHFWSEKSKLATDFIARTVKILTLVYKKGNKKVI
jgi:hypothetical protein